MTDSRDTRTTQLNGASLDIAAQRKRELKQLFPGAFTETGIFFRVKNHYDY